MGASTSSVKRHGHWYWNRDRYNRTKRPNGCDGNEKLDHPDYGKGKLDCGERGNQLQSVLFQYRHRLRDAGRVTDYHII